MMELVVSITAGLAFAGAWLGYIAAYRLSAVERSLVELSEHVDKLQESDEMTDCTFGLVTERLTHLSERLDRHL